MSNITFCCCLTINQATVVSICWSTVRGYLFYCSNTRHRSSGQIQFFCIQVYSLVQLSSIVEQEMTAAVLLEKSYYNISSTFLHPAPLYGSVLQPNNMEREELRVFHLVLLVVFMAVFTTCILLTIGIYKVGAFDICGYLPINRCRGGTA